MGGRTEDGRGAESISARGSDTHGQREKTVGGVPRVREQLEQDNGASAICTIRRLAVDPLPQAKKLVADLTPAHMQARTVLTTLQEHLTVLIPPVSSSKGTIWLPRVPNFSAGDKALVGRWRIYLKWEEGNPLEIEEKDKAQLHTRLQGVYRKALVRMRFFSEIWYVVSIAIGHLRELCVVRYMAYVWYMNLSNDTSLPEQKRKDRKDEALNILKSGIQANPSRYV